ncbi:MAG: NusA N-terminal domain-containing protein [Acidimicrobiales bacterium]
MSNEKIAALQALAEDRGISLDKLFGIMANALESAYKRMPGTYSIVGHDRPGDVRYWRLCSRARRRRRTVRSRIRRHPRQLRPHRGADHKQILTQGIREVERR